MLYTLEIAVYDIIEKTDRSVPVRVALIPFSS